MTTPRISTSFLFLITPHRKKERDRHRKTETKAAVNIVPKNVKIHDARKNKIDHAFVFLFQGIKKTLVEIANNTATMRYYTIDEIIAEPPLLLGISGVANIVTDVLWSIGKLFGAK